MKSLLNTQMLDILKGDIEKTCTQWEWQYMQKDKIVSYFLSNARIIHLQNLWALPEEFIDQNLLWVLGGMCKYFILGFLTEYKALTAEELKEACYLRSQMVLANSFFSQASGNDRRLQSMISGEFNQSTKEIDTENKLDPASIKTLLLVRTQGSFPT
jgi:hypothetical protein